MLDRVSIEDVPPHVAGDWWVMMEEDRKVSLVG